MRNLKSIIFLIFLTAGFTLAQTPTVENWQTFTPAAEEFSVENPFALTAKNFGKNADSTFNRRYKNTSDGTYFFIFSDSKKTLSQTKVVRDFVKDFQKSGMSFPLGTLTGEKFNFADSENFYHTILIVKTNNRSYVFQTVSPTENNPQVERFFASIQIKEKSPVKPENNSETLINIGSGEAHDSGSSSGSDKGAILSSPTLPNQTRSLIITAKPRAAYTEFARFYEITGAVRTRITFLASGEIGDVEPVTKLPFGLTNQAVAAARSIRFEPALKNGQPVNTSKFVEYSFVIY